MTSIDILFQFDDNEDIQDIASESDYHVSHSNIIDTEVVECNQDESTITVRCKVKEGVSNNVVDNDVIPELDYAFYKDCSQKEEYQSELIDYTIN